MHLSFSDAGEQAIILTIDEVPSAQSIGQLKALVDLIQEALGDDLMDVIPSYQSVLVQFNPLTTDHQQTCHRIRSALAEWRHHPPVHTHSKIVRLPVFYDLSVGPDLPRIADHHGCDIEQVIERHCMNLYHIYAIGFAPGFAYLGHVDETIAMPRLNQPRAHVPAGSVAIADHQTAVYPKASPGGWNIIGRCPSPLFQPEEAQALPFSVGDRIQFMPISKQEFLDLGGRLNDV